jgi:hypothetical protein
MTHHTTHHTHGALDVTQEHSILNDVHEDMAVYDASGDKVGEVEFVHFGVASETDRAHGSGPATVTSANDGYDQPLADIFASIFNPGELPDELAEKLYHSGFVRMDSDGLFAADRYITPEQIARVDHAGDHKGVHLSVTRDGLIKRV